MPGANMIWTDGGLWENDANPPIVTQSNWVSGIYDNFGEKSVMKQTFNEMTVSEANFLLQFEARVNIITAGDYEFDLSADN